MKIEDRARIRFNDRGPVAGFEEFKISAWQRGWEGGVSNNL